MRRIARLREDRGATMVIVAVAMVALLGLAGLAIDVGAIYVERRELGRGADAAALAVAEDCARGVACTTAAALVTADEYADANADDGAAAIQSLVIDHDARTVEVTTKTIDPADGTDQFKLFFMRALGFESTTVTATAIAQWGFGARGDVPLIISECEWDLIAESTYSEPVTIYLHDPQSPESGAARPCPKGPAGANLPGGFGWLQTTSGCDAELGSNSNPMFSATAYSEPGNTTPQSCRKEFESLVYDKTIGVPYFAGFTSSGKNATYDVVNFGGFHIIGYSLGSMRQYPGSNPCDPGQSCIQGYFDTTYVYEGPIGGGPNRGLIVVKLIG